MCFTTPTITWSYFKYPAGEAVFPIPLLHLNRISEACSVSFMKFAARWFWQCQRLALVIARLLQVLGGNVSPQLEMNPPRNLDDSITVDTTTSLLLNWKMILIYCNLVKDGSRRQLSQIRRGWQI